MILVVLGHKESGKTQLTRRFLEEVPRSVCVDTIGEYGGVVIQDPHSLAEYLEDNKRQKHLRVAYRDKGDGHIPIALVFKMLHSVRNTWVCVEEASKFGNANTMLPEVQWFPQYGRHYGLHSIFVARRPQEINRMVTAQADTVVSFVQQEPRDLEYIRDLGGEAAAERVRRLGQYEWGYVVDGSSEIRGILSRISTNERGKRAGLSTNPGMARANGGDGGDRVGRTPGVVHEAIGEGNEGARDRTEGGGSAGVVPIAGDDARDGASRGGGQAAD